MAVQRLSSKFRLIQNISGVLPSQNSVNVLSGTHQRFFHFHVTCKTFPSKDSSLLIPRLSSLTNENHVRCLHLSSSYCAGHSKWSNIKHVKGAQDRARGEKSSALARKLQFVLSKNPEKNPKLNSELATLIKWARTNNIPNDVIDRTIDRTIKLRDPANLTIFEGRGPSNTGLVMECLTLKPLHTKGLLQGVVKKYGFNLNSSTADLFNHKGIVEVDVPEAELQLAQNEPDNFPLDKYIDIAIEAGAEDVTLQSDSEKPYLEFTCAPQDCDRVQGNIDNAGLMVTSSERSFIPTTLVPASKQYIDSINILKDKLDIHPDVVKYYTNVVPENE